MFGGEVDKGALNPLVDPCTDEHASITRLRLYTLRHMLRLRFWCAWGQPRVSPSARKRNPSRNSPTAIVGTGPKRRCIIPLMPIHEPTELSSHKEIERILVRAERDLLKVLSRTERSSQFLARVMLGVVQGMQRTASDYVEVANEKQRRPRLIQPLKKKLPR